MTGPCLCGDPGCINCGGDPSLAKLEAITDEFYDLIKKESVATAQAALINTKHFIASFKEFSPIIVLEVRESIAELARDEKEKLTKHAKELELEED